jgi:hypothetical protein
MPLNRGKKLLTLKRKGLPSAEFSALIKPITDNLSKQYNQVVLTILTD